MGPTKKKKTKNSKKDRKIVTIKPTHY